MTDRMLQFFVGGDEVSEPFSILAEWVVKHLPPNPERTAGLRKLLEAKDCIVRAKLYKEPIDEKFGSIHTDSDPITDFVKSERTTT